MSLGLESAEKLELFGRDNVTAKLRTLNARSESKLNALQKYQVVPRQNSLHAWIRELIDV